MFNSLTYESSVDRLPDRVPSVAYVAPPLGTFIACSVLPPCAFPISVVYGATTVRCLATTRVELTSWIPDEKKYVKNDIFPVVHRRYANPWLPGALKEEAIVHDEVTKDRVRQFIPDSKTEVWIDDPNNPNEQYMLFLRKRYTEGYLWLRENAWMSLIGDFCQCYLPFGLSLMFFRPAFVFMEDMKLVMKHELSIYDIRHPVMNFFRDVKWERPAAKKLPRLRFTGRML